MNEYDLTPEQRTELGDLQPLYGRLSEYDVPDPDEARLLAALTPLLTERTQAQPVETLELESRGFRDWLGLAWAQTALLEMPFWLSSVVLTLIGLFLGLNYNSAFAVLVLILISPLLAVAGVAYIFRPATHTLWELERLSRIQPFELLYARLALILIVNVGLAIVLLLGAWTQGLQVVLWRLLLIWFGPMVGLMGIALFCSVRWNVVVGVVVPMITWTGVMMLGWREIVLNTQIHLLTPDRLVLFIDGSNTLLLIALVGLLFGSMLFYGAGRWVTKWR